MNTSSFLTNARLPVLVAALLAAVPSAMDAQVNLAWTARFSGPSNVIDQARAIVTDAAGNVYITGGADRNGPTLGGDIVTVKFDRDGQQVWAARSGIPGAAADAPTAMTRDAAGFIYVTGYSYGSASNVASQDYVTLKYAPDGTQLWAARFSGPTNSPSGATSVDYPRAIVVDNAGNVYVTGTTSDSGGNNRDYATVKYDANGGLLWSSIYDTPNHASDSATSLAVNGSGEVYVGGLSGVVKYSPGGNLLWTWPVPVTDLALDPAGNPVLVGPSFLEPEDEGEEPDLKVTKFSTQGAYLWSATYDGALDEADGAELVRIDGAGNIYVTGSSAKRCKWIDDDGHEEKVCDTSIVTLKFDPNGQQLWAARYGDGEVPMHFPIGMALDPGGNAYVVGSVGPWSRTVTIKYGPNGTRLWSTVYSATNHGWDSPAGIALSPGGDVLVAGSSHWTDGGGSDYFALKYVQSNPPGFPEILTPPQKQIVALGSNVTFTVSAAGAEPLRYQWLLSGILVDGATNATLTLTHVAWDQEGDYSVEVSNSAGSVVSADARLEIRYPLNFYGEPQRRSVIVGDTVQFEFAASGQYPVEYQWLHDGVEIPGATSSILRLTNVQLGQSGVYTLRAADRISAGTSPDARLQVTALARKCWETRPAGNASGSFESGGKIAIDAGGNVYVAASLLGVVKYDAAGRVVWTTPYPGEVQGMAVDSTGNIYVTGFQRSHDDDFLTVKYSPGGSQLWARTYDGPVHDTDRATAIKVDNANNVIVTGWALGASGGTQGRHQDYVTIKYDANGNQLWLAVFDSPDHRQDFAYALDVDVANNIYVTGQSPAAGTRSWDAATVKYSPSGTQIWLAYYQSSATNSSARDVKVDVGGNVYVAGAGWGIGSRSDGFIAKYDTQGRQLWATTYNGSGNGSDSIGRIVLDPAGNVLACGSTSRGNSSVYDAVLLKLSSNGQRLWTALFGPGDYNGAQDVAVDSLGNPYLLANAGTSSRNTFVTSKYDPNGNRLWESRFFEEDHSWPGSLVVSPAGEVFVSGATDKDAAAWNLTRMVTLKYCPGEVAGVPTIVEPPHDLTVAAGGDGQFQVTATGQPPLSYRWGVHKIPMQPVGGDSATLSLTDIQGSQAGDYFVEVCNDLGCAVSPVARLTVQPVPPLLHSPWRVPQSFGFTVNGSVLFPVVIEMSTDLRTWTVLATNQMAANVTSLSFPKTGADAPARFFRARSLPDPVEESASDD